MGKVSRLTDPEFAEQVAELYVGGMNRADMAAEFNVHKDTITVWIHDKRVTKIAARLMQDRVSRITRRIDSELEQRLSTEKIEKLGTVDLLKIRKTMEPSLPPDVRRSGAGRDLGTAIEDILNVLDANPELAAKVAGIPDHVAPEE